MSAADDDWRTYDELAVDSDTYRLPSADLSGTELTVAATGGPLVEYRFGDRSTVRWTASGPGWDGAAGTDDCDAVEVGERALFLNVAFASRPREALTTVLDRLSGRALVVHSQIDERAAADRPQVRQTFWPATIAGREPSGPAPAPTRDLIGRRALYRYSPTQLYEHVYLNSERYAWQCLQGVQRGHGDVDLASTYKLDSGLYVFAFREFRIPVATVWLYDMEALTTTGIFLGLTAGGEPMVTRGGGRIMPLGCVTYPEGVAPA